MFVHGAIETTYRPSYRLSSGSYTSSVFVQLAKGAGVAVHFFFDDFTSAIEFDERVLDAGINTSDGLDHAVVDVSYHGVRMQCVERDATRLRINWSERNGPHDGLVIFPAPVEEFDVAKMFDEEVARRAE